MNRKNIVLLCMAILFICCDKKDGEKDYPFDVKIQDFALSESCTWQNLKPETVYLINSDTELSEYFSCQADIDFNKYSLLVVLGSEENKVYELTKQLIQISQDEYEFKINVILEDTIVTPNWVVSILVPKISNEAQIHLKPQILLPVSKELLVGKWELFKYVDLTTSAFTTKPDSITGAIVINFYDSPTFCGFPDSVTFSAYSFCNSIHGDYELASNSIKFIYSRITLVLCEPKWIREFEDVLCGNDTDLIKRERDTDVLFIFYSQSQKIMLFNKIN